MHITGTCYITVKCMLQAQVKLQLHAFTSVRLQLNALYNPMLRYNSIHVTVHLNEFYTIVKFMLLSNVTLQLNACYNHMPH